MKISIIRIILLALLITALPTGFILAEGQKEADMADPGPKVSMGPGSPAAPPEMNGGEYMKPSDMKLKEMLTDLQYNVTQHEGTERPFNNEYWNNHEEGIYVDIVSGEPLFSSKDKYDSGTGWPSFTRPLEPGNITSNEDRSYGMVRVEVRSLYADSHLGHLFNDGPQPTGMRYCINSASLRFIPVDKLEEEGYGNYLYLFEN